MSLNREFFKFFFGAIYGKNELFFLPSAVDQCWTMTRYIGRSDLRLPAWADMDIENHFIYPELLRLSDGSA